MTRPPAERLLLLAGRLAELGDKQGHPFRGNQWVDTDMLLKHPALTEVIDRFKQAGIPLYVVGGPVRDLIHEGHPGTDLDMTSPASVEDTKRLVDDLGALDPSGEQYGTVKLHRTLPNGEKWAVEITQHRTEEYEPGSRKPTTRGTEDLRPDLARRDFTINSMALDTASGEIHDPFGGRDDLQAGRLRTPLDPVRTFSDDPLRIMRLVRFAATKGLVPDTATLEAVAATREGLATISTERKRIELEKVLKSTRPGALAQAVSLSTTLGVSEHLFGGLDVHALQAGADLDVIHPANRLAALAYATGPSARKAMTALKLTNDQIHAATRRAELARSVLDGTDARRLVRAHTDEELDSAQQILAAYGHAPSPALTAARHHAAALRRKLPVTGRDAPAGVKGKEIGAWLGRVEDALLANPDLTRDEALTAAGCTDRSCAPPPTGTGGSRPTGDGMGLTPEMHLERGLDGWRFWEPAKGIRQAAERITGVESDAAVFEPQIGERAPLTRGDWAYGGPPEVSEAEEDRLRKHHELQAAALLDELSRSDVTTRSMYRYVNVPEEALTEFDRKLHEDKHLDVPLTATGNSVAFVERFAHHVMHDELPPMPEGWDPPDAFEDDDDKSWRDELPHRTHVPTLLRVLPGARHISPARHGQPGTATEPKTDWSGDSPRTRPGRYMRGADGKIRVNHAPGQWEEYITGGHFEVVSDQSVRLPNPYHRSGDPEEERWQRETVRVVTLRQLGTYDGDGNYKRLRGNEPRTEFGFDPEQPRDEQGRWADVPAGWEKYVKHLRESPSYLDHTSTHLSTSAVEHYREYDRSGPNLDAVDAGIDTIRNPLWIKTDGTHALLVEGNHRLAMARRRGLDKLPVRITYDDHLAMRLDGGELRSAQPGARPPQKLEPELAAWLRKQDLKSLVGGGFETLAAERVVQLAKRLSVLTAAGCQDESCAPPPVGTGGSRRGARTKTRKTAALRPAGWRPMMSRQDAEDWAAGSAVPDVLTHVTKAADAEKIMRRGWATAKLTTGAGGLFGPGVYGSLIGDLIEVDKWGPTERTTEIGSEPTSFYKGLKTSWRSGGGETATLRLKVKVERPFHLTLPDSAGEAHVYAQVLPQLAAANPDAAAMFSEYRNQYGTPRGRALRAALIANGYDSIIVHNEPFAGSVGGSQVIVFDRKKVTVIDPSDDPSHHLFASAARAVALSGKLAALRAAGFKSGESRDERGRWTATGSEASATATAELEAGLDTLDASETKAAVCKALAKTMKSSTLDLVRAVAVPLPGTTEEDVELRPGSDEAATRERCVAKLMQAWAHSTSFGLGNHLRQVAVEEFALKDAWTSGNGAERRSEAVEAVYRDFLRTQYEATQAVLSKRGITELDVYRGMLDAELQSGPHEVRLAGLSSFSLHPQVAKGFAGLRGSGDYELDGVLLTATVPASRILSLPTTGIGCLSESEAVVLGGRMRADVKRAYVDLAAFAGAAIDADQRNADWIIEMSRRRPVVAAGFNPQEPRDEHGRWVADQGPSPLDYRMGGVRRLAVVVPDAGETKQTYFAETERRTTKGRRTIVTKTPGAEPGTTAFLDWTPVAKDAWFINYMSTRADYRQKGMARQLATELYERAAKAGVKEIDWGDVYDEHLRSVIDSMTERHPKIHTRFKVSY